MCGTGRNNLCVEFIQYRASPFLIPSLVTLKLLQPLHTQITGKLQMITHQTTGNDHSQIISKEDCLIDDLDSRMHWRSEAEKGQSVIATKLMAHSTQTSTASGSYQVKLNTEVSAGWSALTILSCAGWLLENTSKRTFQAVNSLTVCPKISAKPILFSKNHLQHQLSDVKDW